MNKYLAIGIMLILYSVISILLFPHFMKDSNKEARLLWLGQGICASFIFVMWAL